MDLNLKNKVAVVLAGSRGLGFGIADSLAREGCQLALCSRDSMKLSAATESLSSRYHVQVFSRAVDITDVNALKEFLAAVVDQLGGIDILVANSGGPPPGACLDLTVEDFSSAFDLVFLTKVIAAQFSCKEMIKKGSGRIIFIESTSVKQNMQNMVLSNSMRSASAAFAKTLSAEVGKEGIRVHTILVGPFKTDRVKELGDVAAQHQNIAFTDWLANAEENTPLGRFGDPAELGDIVSFLSSDKSSYMNGTTTVVDGGIITANF